MNKSIKIILITILALGLLSSICDAQSKRDSIRLDTNDIKMLYRNAQIIQQTLHGVHLDAILRDKLDSVYQQSAVLFESKLRKVVKKGGK